MAYLLAFTLLIAPAYALRFPLFGYPTNALMIWIFVVWLIFIGWLTYKRQVSAFLRSVFFEYRLSNILIGLFFLAGALSLFVDGFSIPKLGQFIVWFLQPIGTYYVARFVARQEDLKQPILIVSYFFVAICGMYAALQYFTLLGLPSDWWGNSSEPKRATAYFLHPNFYALYITPLLAFLIPDVVERAQTMFKRATSNWVVVAAWLLGLFGLFLSLSRGGWLGFLAALIVFLAFSANKKYITTAVIGLVIAGAVVAVVPNWRYRVLLPFYGEKSSVARLSLWKTGAKMIKDDPVFGKGLLGFSNSWDTYNTDPGLRRYPAPHNIFLNFWIETGLLGLVSFMILLAYSFLRGIANRKNVFAFGVSLFLVALFVHGQIDIPYLKNDLALAFWLVLALL